MFHFDLATEDALSEAIGLRLMQEVPGLQPGLLLRRGGSGYLRSRLKAFCEMARHRPLLVITDLDTARCPADLRSRWLGKLRQPAALLIRVAVTEVEAWLLADHVSMTAFLGQNAARHLPDEPDLVTNPKSLLLDLARRAPRDVRSDLCATAGAIARQGVAYNARLCGFVQDNWDPQRAASKSMSLQRCRHRLSELAAEHEQGFHQGQS